MKKQNVYSASDFVNASSAVVVENTYWTIDNIGFTAVGEFSKAPLFELELRKIVGKQDNVPEGYVDASAELEPNRTYFVREGRPLYNALAQVWESVDGDPDSVRSYVQKEYSSKAYRGRVERLTGVSYLSQTKRGTIIQRSRFECWYPDVYEEGRIMDDFIYLCNRGVYNPVVEKPTDPLADAIKGLDPKIVAAIKAAMSK